MNSSKNDNGPLSKEMGARIASLREEMHITQEKLAEVMGISTKHLSAVERGKSRFSYEKLLFFCRFFDCSTDYIFFGRDKEITGEIPTEILSILSSDDQEEKKRLRDYLLMYVKLRSNR